MFFISKNVASGIKALRKRDHVARELAAIRAMPGFEVYVNAIAEGVKPGEGVKGKSQRKSKGRRPDEAGAPTT